MLLREHYHALLGLSVFALVTLCGASKNIKFDLQKLKEQHPVEATSSYMYKQHVIEIEKRQNTVVPSIGTITPGFSDTGPVTDTTTEFDTVVVTPSSPAPVTITFVSTATTSTVPPFTSPISSKTTSTAPQPTITSTGSSSTPSPTGSPLGSGVPLSGIAIGGIIAGCVIGVSVFFLAGWCTYRRLRNRGNYDPPGGVPTTNFFDPTASMSPRTLANGPSPRYPMQDQDYFSKQPTIPILNYPTAHPQVFQPSEQMAEMPANPVSYLQGANWWGAPGQVPLGELQEQDNAAVFEVEGTTPEGGRSRRWSKPFMKR